MPDTDRPGRVLVADADAGVRSFVRLTLTEAGYEIDEAVETTETVVAVARSRPRVLLVDQALPGAGGEAIARSLRSQPETDATVIVMLYDKAAPIDLEAAREAGVDDFLAKPFTAYSLLRKLIDLRG